MADQFAPTAERLPLVVSPAGEQAIRVAVLPVGVTGESRLQVQVRPLERGRTLVSAAELWPGTPYVLFTVVPILSVAAGIAVHRYRVRRAEAVCGPQHLFVELCRRHSIDAGGQRLLKRIAAGAKLSQPAEMFVLPSRFDAAIAAAAGLRPREGETLSHIRQQLFGEEAEELPNGTTSSFSCPFPRSLPS